MKVLGVFTNLEMAPAFTVLDFAEALGSPRPESALVKGSVHRLAQPQILWDSSKWLLERILVK